ncbi:hypothetical protein ACFY9A_28770 [Streptomyces rubradiris]|uniref:hypothetical protein n=1 Tax=Streptomyces rubradiris TaxID=285531 RepID=UPI0036E50836
MSAQSSREERLAQLLTTIRDHPGKWTAGRLHKARRVTGGPEDGRYFTFRKDDHA